MGASGDRDEVIAQFKAYFESDHELQEAASQQLPGRALVCAGARRGNDFMLTLSLPFGKPELLANLMDLCALAPARRG